jgi:hypothetical protein
MAELSLVQTESLKLRGDIQRLEQIQSRAVDDAHQKVSEQQLDYSR